MNIVNHAYNLDMDFVHNVQMNLQNKIIHLHVIVLQMNFCIKKSKFVYNVLKNVKHAIIMKVFALFVQKKQL